MADYYNTTRGPLSVTLNDGTSCSLPPKAWIYITPGNENSASISKLTSKGLLVRSKVALTAPPIEAVAVAVEVAPVTLVKAVEVEVPAPAPVAPVVTSAMKEEIARKKR